jgi:hypothetical protein
MAMDFTHTPNGPSGTSLKGFLPPTTYARLVEVFGQPDYFGGDKVDAEWVLTFADGIVATIYNYKDGRAYNGPSAPPVEDLTDWHVGGFNPAALTRVADALGTKNTQTISQRYGG